MQPVKAAPEPIYFPDEPIYTSVVTFALAFVTLTPNCLARAMMSIRFREETALAILCGEKLVLVCVLLGK
jgi:hypothetical protein